MGAPQLSVSIRTNPFVCFRHCIHRLLWRVPLFASDAPHRQCAFILLSGRIHMLYPLFTKVNFLKGTAYGYPVWIQRLCLSDQSSLLRLDHHPFHASLSSLQLSSISTCLRVHNEI